MAAGEGRTERDFDGRERHWHDLQKNGFDGFVGIWTAGKRRYWSGSRTWRRVLYSMERGSIPPRTDTVRATWSARPT